MLYTNLMNLMCRHDGDSIVHVYLHEREMYRTFREAKDALEPGFFVYSVDVEWESLTKNPDFIGYEPYRLYSGYANVKKMVDPPVGELKTEFFVLAISILAVICAVIAAFLGLSYESRP